MDRVSVLRVVSDDSSDTRAFKDKSKAQACAKEIIEAEMELVEAEQVDVDRAIRQLNGLGRYSHDQFVITLVELEVE